MASAGGDFARVKENVRFTSDDLEGALAGAIAGLGVSVLPRWLVARTVEEGSLVRLVPEESLPCPSVVAVYPHRLRRVARQVLDRVARHVARELGESAGGSA